MRLLLLVFASVLAAGEAPFPVAAEGLAPDPAVSWGRLDNGLRYCLMANQQPRDRISLRLQVEAGSLFEEEKQRGLAHFLEHMAFNGSTHYPPGELVPVLQRLGLSFGGDSNAHTSFDETVYQLDLPDAEPATLATGLTVLADMAGGMLILPKEADRERGVILAEMRDRNTPGYREWEAAAAAEYPGLRIGERMPIGTEASVTAGGAPEMRAFYERWYVPSRMILSVVGAIDPAAVGPAVKAHFAGMPKRDRPADVPLGTLADEPLRILYHREPEADETTVALSLVRPGPRPADAMEVRRQTLLRNLAERVLRRRLQDLAEADPQGPVLAMEDVGSGWWLDLFHARVEAQARPGKALAAIPVVERELRRMRQFGPLDAELAVEKKAIASELDVAVARAADRTNGSLAVQLYRSVHDDQAFITPQRLRELDKPWLDAATAAEARDAFAAAWDHGHLLVDVSGKEAIGADAEAGQAQVRAAWEESAKAPVEQRAATAAVAWAYGERPAAGEAAESRTLTHGITAARYANNLLAQVMRTDFKQNEILVQARIELDGEPLPPAGAAEFADRAFLAGGLGKHSGAQMRELFAGNSIRTSFSVGESGVVIGGSCLPEDLELCLQRLRAEIVDPGWRADAEAQAKAGWLEELKSLDTDLNQRVMRAFDAALVHDDPARRAATPAEAEAMSFAVLRAWLGPILEHGSLSVSVVGDVDAERARGLIASYFASLPARKPHRVIGDLSAPGALRAALPILAGQAHADVPGSVARALVVCAWPTEDAGDAHRLRRIGLLASALTERMRIRIRQEFGQAYSPYAGMHASDAYAGFGYIAAVVAVAPDQVDRARATIASIAADLVEKGVDDALVTQIKTPVTKSLPVRLRQNGYWLDQVAMRCQFQPQRLAWVDDLAPDYDAISAADLSAFAKRYLVADRSYTVVGVCAGAPAAK